MKFGVLKDIKNGEYRVIATPAEVSTFISNRYNIARQLPEVDMLVNCVRWPKDATEFLVDREMVRSMHPGSVIVDISNDYGVIETFRAILNRGVKEACARDGYLRRGLTAYRGYLTHEEASAIQNRPWVPPEVILGIENEKLDPAPPATKTRSGLFYETVPTEL